MASQTADLIAQVSNVRFNPIAIQGIQLNALQGVLAGNVDVVDATNPFAFLMEMASTLTAACMSEDAVSTRKLYPSMALSLNDLYLHMSDLDYVGLFASPGIARIRLLFDRAEIYSKVVPTGVGGISQITIPRETYFQVGQYIFTMQYPINIRVMGHGGLSIVYDTSMVSPLQNLPTNIVTWSITTIAGNDYIELDIPVYQMQISSNYGSINRATGFEMIYNYPNQYYYCRVYASNPSTGKWTELVTTYTDQVFDPATPTAVLKVLQNNQLQVEIPQVYISSGQVTTEIRTDIFTTMGPIDLVLSDYQLNSWTATWVDLDSSTNQSYISPYSAPLKSLATVIVGSNDTVAGGSSAPSFASIRSRVLANAIGNNSLPITSAQLGSTLQNLGYNAVANVDDVTNRIYLATRTLPPPNSSTGLNVSSGVGASVLTLQSSMNELVLQSTVSDNGNRITIQPQTLYSVKNGLVSVVSDATVASLNGMSQDGLIGAINTGNFVFTPFHYVMDINNDQYSARSYYLDQPQVAARSYVAENDTLGMNVATGLYQLVRTYAKQGGGAVDGYALYVITSSDANYQALADNQLAAQLAFVPEGEVDLAYINGTLVSHSNPDGSVNPSGTERLWLFQFATNYDLDANDNLCLTNFSMFANAPANHFTPLTGVFQLIYCVNGVVATGQTHSSIDQSLNLTNLPSTTYGLSQEKYTINLGTPLTGLWHRARSVASSQNYARYTAPVYWTYPQTVYVRDPITGNILITNDNGVLSYTVLHHQGDPVLDATSGLPLIKYNVGDVQVDGAGNPIVIMSRSVIQQTDMLFLDGIYWFANSPPAQKYIQSIPETIIGWLENDISTVSKNLLEQTTLYLYPTSTMGSVQGSVVAGKTVSVEARMSFTVDYYLTGVGYRNSLLRLSLESLAASTFAQALQNQTISMNSISDTLTNSAGSDVVALDISGLGGSSNNYTMLTVLDSSIALSIGQLAVANDDGTIGVVDDITVNFIQHSAN